MDRAPLTPRQGEVLEVIRRSFADAGYGPTIREIAESLGISSPNGVVTHLRALEAKGYIQRAAHLSRSIQLVDGAEDSPGIPLGGLVAAGSPAGIEEQAERLDIEGWLRARPGCWALRVSGDSMIEAHIADGDYVIVQPASTARAGQMAVVRTDEGEATLKFWFPEKDRIRLQPANASLRPVFVRSAEVLGIVIGVVRKLAP